MQWVFSFLQRRLLPITLGVYDYCHFWIKCVVWVSTLIKVKHANFLARFSGIDLRQPTC